MNAELMKTFSVRLTRRMQEACLSNAELARRLKIEPTLVNRWRCGNAYPQGTMMRRLANVLNLEEDYLSGESERKKEQAEENALRAEQMLADGDIVESVISACGYKNAAAMFSAIAMYSKAPPYTTDEQGSFYTAFKRYMKEKALTQAQLSWSVGLSVSTVQKWASGAGMPPRCLIPRIAGMFGITGRELLGGKPLVEDTEKAAPAPVPPKKVETIAKAPVESDPVTKDVGGLCIKVQYAAEATGRYASYSFDGHRFRMPGIAADREWTPEEFLGFGEEIQQAALNMTK